MADAEQHDTEDCWKNKCVGSVEGRYFDGLFGTSSDHVALSTSGCTTAFPNIGYHEIDSAPKSVAQQKHSACGSAQ